MKGKTEKAFLKYGEKIILVSSRQNLYLGSRGIDFQAGFYARCKQPYLVNKFSLYPNLDEIIFELHPNLNYESLLEYNECSHSDPNKEILHKRMVLEQNLNTAKIEENRGKHVKLGSTIQIYHPNSKTYLSFNAQKLLNSEMGVIGCSSENSESVQFTISSPFDFLKEGSLISYEDKFIFSDAYNKTLAYPLSHEEMVACKMDIEVKVEKGLMRLFDISKQKEPKVPGIVETQQLFEGYLAGYVTEKAIGTGFFNQFEAINIEGYYDENDLKENDLKYGDMVNVRRVDSSGRYSLMFAEVNKTSYRGAVLYRTFPPDSAIKLVNVEAQFQLVNVGMKASGGSITFDKFNSTSVMLKHVLSGKFLWVDPDSKRVTLSPDFDGSLEYIKNNKTELEKEYGKRYVGYSKIKENKKFEDITKKDAHNLTQVDIDYYQQHGKNLFVNEEDYFLAYVMLHTFVLEKVSSDEGLSLNNSTFLKIRTHSNQFVSVKPDETYLHHLNDVTKKEEENLNFELNFYKEMGNKMTHETVVETETFDIFHFEKTDKELVRRFTEFNSFTAFISRILRVPETKQFLTLQFISILKNILDISRNLISTKKLSKHVLQYLLVQTSLVDLLMEYLVKVRAGSKDSEENVSLLTESCQKVLEILSLACENNTTVCTYVFQWRHFFTASIVKNDSVVFRHVNIDSLLFQVVDVLKCYSVYIDDYLSNLCSSIRFEQLDIKKLSILLQITKNFQNLQDTVSVSKVFEKIFNPAHKGDIFRKLEFDRFDKTRVLFNFTKDKKIELDESFSDNANIYAYFLQTLNLAVYLGELDSAKTAKNLYEIFPKDVCIALITSPHISPNLRAVFLKLFALLYIISHFNNSGFVSYEELVTSRESDVGRRFSETLKSIEKLKETEENKNFLNSLLENLNTSHNDLALASLKIFNILIGFKFFDTEYIMMIKNNFEEMILDTEKTHRSNTLVQPTVGLDSKRETVKELKASNIADKDKGNLAGSVRELNVRPAEVSESGGFRFQDPATMIEIVDMLIKLHRSLLRFKILSLIKEKRIMKKQLQQPNLGSADGPALEGAIHEVFDEGFAQYIDQQVERNEQVWEVISDWTRFNNPELSSKILKFIHESSLMKYYFLEKYSEFYQVEEQDDEVIYNRLRAYLKSFATVLTELMSEYTTSDFDTIEDKTKKIIKDSQNLFSFLYAVMEPNDRQNKFELSIKESKLFKPKDMNDIITQEVYINVLNIFLMDCHRIKSKQNIFLKCGLLEIVMKMAICFNTKIFVTHPLLEQIEVGHSNFDHIPEFFGKPFKTTAKVVDKEGRKRGISKTGEELNLMLVMFLYYAVATNPENIEFVMTKYEEELHDFILRCLSSPNSVIKETTLCLFVELYKDNLKGLLRLRQKAHPFFEAVLKQVYRELEKKNYRILTNYIELFQVLTHYDEAILEENAKEVFNCLFNENMQAHTTVSHLINKEVIAELHADYNSVNQAKRMDFSQTRDGVIFSKELRDMDDMDERNNIFNSFEISDRLLFISSLLHLISSFGKNCSIDFKSKMQKKLSMSSLIEIATTAKFSYYLKENVVNLLNNIFITTKIDQNSKSFVLDLVSAVLVPDVKEYFRNKTNNLNSKELYFINSTPRVNHLLLESDRRQPSGNCRVWINANLAVSYILHAVSPLIEKFMLICANEGTEDNNNNILESLYDIMDELIEQKDQVVAIFNSAMQHEGPELSPDAKPKKINRSGLPQMKRLVIGSPSAVKQVSRDRAEPKSPLPMSSKGPPEPMVVSVEDLSHFARPRDPSYTGEERFETVEGFMEHFGHKTEDLASYFQKEESSDGVDSQRRKSRSILLKLSLPQASAHDKDRSKVEKQRVFFDQLTSLYYIKTHHREKPLNTDDVFISQGKDKPIINKSKTGPLQGGVRRSSLRDGLHNSHGRNNIENSYESPVESPEVSPRLSVKESQDDQPKVKQTPSKKGLADGSEAKLLVTPVPNRLEYTEQPERRDVEARSPSASATHTTSIKKTPSGFATQLSPGKKKKKVTLAAGGSFITVGKQEIPISAKISRSYITPKRMEQFQLHLAEVIQQPTLDAECRRLILEYWTYLLDNPVFVPFILEAFRIEGTVKYLLQSIALDKAGGKENMRLFSLIINLINKILQLDRSFTKDFLDDLLKDQDNKILNQFWTALQLTFRTLFELEELYAQFKEKKENFSQAFGTDAVLARNEEMVWSELRTHSNRLLDLLLFPQLLCSNLDPIMQGLLRTQTINGMLKPNQVNAFDVLKEMTKTYLKIVKPHNLSIAYSILTLFTKMVQGPCKDNQRELISKKIIGVIDEIYSAVYQMQDAAHEKEKSTALTSSLILKLGAIECSTDSLLIKTLAISLNSELLWSRLEQIYCSLFYIKSETVPAPKKSSLNKAVRAMKKLIPDKQKKAEAKKILLLNKLEEIKKWGKSAVERNKKNIQEGEDYSPLMKEGLYILIWMNQMAELDPEIGIEIAIKHETMSFTFKNISKASGFFQQKIRSIEVIDSNKTLQTIYFYVHPINEFLSSTTMHHFEDEIDRRSSNSKLLGLVIGVEHMHYEMRHFEKISSYGIKANLSYLHRTKMTAFLLSLILNFIFLVSTDMTAEKKGEPAFRPWGEHKSTERLGFVLAWLIFGIYIFLLFLWIIFEYSVKKQMFSQVANKHRETSIKDSSVSKRSKTHKRFEMYLKARYHIQVWKDLIFKTDLVVIICCLLTCLLGFAVSKFYFSFLLLDIISLSPLLKSIIKSLTLNYQALGGTAVFGFILIFVYTSFLFFYSDYVVSNLPVLNNPNTRFCETFTLCYLDMITFGLRSGGGVGDVLELPDSLAYRSKYIARTFFDLIFWVTIILLLLNIVLGIIIDSFAELRDHRDQIENDKTNICFICNLDKGQFHSSSLPFDTHILKVHNLWNYFSYIIGLLEKKPGEMNGLETEIYWKYKNMDLSWFPLHKTKNLVEKTEEEAWLKEKLKSIEGRIDRAILEKIDALNSQF